MKNKLNKYRILKRRSVKASQVERLLCYGDGDMKTDFAGLFICKDKNGIDCCVGDLIAVTEPGISTQDRRGNVNIHEENIYIGKLEMSIEKGYYLKGDNLHFQPPLHNSPHLFNSRKTWEWFKC